jgi:hypothetical protein
MKTHLTRGASTLLVLSVLSFGLLTGAMLLIGISMVGFWKSLTPSEFVSWFAANSSRLGTVMIPLGAITLLLSLGAVDVSWRSQSKRWPLIAALCALCVMITYPVFFAGANATFITGLYRIRPFVCYSTSGRYGTGAVRFWGSPVFWLPPWQFSRRATQTSLNRRANNASTPLPR